MENLLDNIRVRDEDIASQFTAGIGLRNYGPKMTDYGEGLITGWYGPDRIRRGGVHWPFLRPQIERQTEGLIAAESHSRSLA
jgi:hypothetical protein